MVLQNAFVPLCPCIMSAGGGGVFGVRLPQDSVDSPRGEATLTGLLEMLQVDAIRTKRAALRFTRWVCSRFRRARNLL